MSADNMEKILPDREVAERFGVRILADLGGRLNRHWLVEKRGERLVLRRWAGSGGDVDYEVRLSAGIAALGWPVATVVEGPVELCGRTWCLFTYLRGDHCAEGHGAAGGQRARGRLLAEFHSDLSRLSALGQRRNWRRCEDILADPALDRLLAENSKRRSEEAAILRWHLDRARRRIEGLNSSTMPGIIVHGDFTPWNLLYEDGCLSGILDFELAHWDHRIGDFALSWRGKYDEVIRGYDEVSPLEPKEWELITPMWWAQLIELACRHLAEGSFDDGWIIRKLLQRSPLMGVDSAPYPGL